MVSGDISTGASSDIKQATNLARSMVCQWGMSEKLGMVQYGADDEYFLGRDMVRRKDYSEATAREIDEEVRRIIEERLPGGAGSHRNAPRQAGERSPRRCLEFETLDGWQVVEIIRTGRFTPAPQQSNIDPPSGAQAATSLPEVPKSTPPKLPGFGAAAPAAAFCFPGRPEEADSALQTLGFKPAGDGIRLRASWRDFPSAVGRTPPDGGVRSPIPPIRGRRRG
jgi:cell division protease FtsH